MQSESYWSSSAAEPNPNAAWLVGLATGVGYYDVVAVPKGSVVGPNNVGLLVWPVRGRQ